jgi:hypothetical protein
VKRGRLRADAQWDGGTRNAGVAVLQGSLDEFRLAEVLSLLAATRKSGELRVSDDRGTDGRVWLDDGCIVSCRVGMSTDPVDTVFELLRMTGGAFTFSAGNTPSQIGARRDVAPLLAEAHSRLEEWRTIEAVVPSLAYGVALADELGGEDTIVNAAQWKVLVAVAHGGTVDAVATSLDLGEFGACKAVKGLVDAGLVDVAPIAHYASMAEHVPAVHDERTLDGNGDVDRSVVMKFLSAVVSDDRSDQ